LLRSDPDRARRILEEGLRANPDAPTLHYNLACLESLQGDRTAAVGELRRAIAGRPEAAGWARDDEDFASLRDDPEFRGLVGPD
jgi:adenylate cyclase